TFDRGPWACDTGPGTMTCRATVPANQFSLLQFHLRPQSSGTFTVTGTVSADAGPDGDPSDDTASVTTTVGPEPGPPVLSQGLDSDTIGTSHLVTARSDAANGTLVTFGLDGPAAPPPGGPWTGFAGTPTGDRY